MIYILSGKKDTAIKYMHNNNYSGREAMRIDNGRLINNKEFYETDTLVLLGGWWGLSHNVKAFTFITTSFPNIKIEYLDGLYGEDFRKQLLHTPKNDLESDIIYDRFSILDL